MTPEDLDLVVARTRHERFRWLTSDDNPDRTGRERYRAIVAAMAAAPPIRVDYGPPPERGSGGCCG